MSNSFVTYDHENRSICSYKKRELSLHTFWQYSEICLVIGECWLFLAGDTQEKQITHRGGKDYMERLS